MGTDLQITDASCSSCGLSLKAIFIGPSPLYFYCDKVECIVKVAIMRGKNWRAYVKAKDIPEAIQIVKTLVKVS